MKDDGPSIFYVTAVMLRTSQMEALSMPMHKPITAQSFQSRMLIYVASSNEAIYAPSVG